MNQTDEAEEYRSSLCAELGRLADSAKSSDELSYLFSLLGVNSGAEDAGWQPIGETEVVIRDLTALINGPIRSDTAMRLVLFLYCHIIEANYIYHCVFNLLRAVEGKPPTIFSFLEKYRKGAPPTLNSKLKEIEDLCVRVEFTDLFDSIMEIQRPDIRNAFFHSDYIIFNDQVRLKHRGSQIKRIDYDEIVRLLEKALTFFHSFRQLQLERLSSYEDGQKIDGRVGPDGQRLAAIEVIVRDGIASGFRSSDPFPFWPDQGNSESPT